VSCSELQCALVCCSVLQISKLGFRTPLNPMSCSVSQCVAECRSALPVCCRMLQRSKLGFRTPLPPSHIATHSDQTPPFAGRCLRTIYPPTTIMTSSRKICNTQITQCTNQICNTQITQNERIGRALRSMGWLR